MTARRSRSRFRTLGLAAVVVAGAGHLQTSSALVRPKGADAPGVAASRGGRSHRTLTMIDRAGQLARTGLPMWKAQFDDDTGVPLRMWGSTPAIAHVVDDATVAEAASRAFLTNHLAVLAPGAAITDFTLLANELAPSGIRTVTFQQHAHGIAVKTAAVNFAFKADRLMMVGSTAMPNVTANVSVPMHTVAPAVQLATAARWLGESGHAIAQHVEASFIAPPRVIIPIVRPRLGASPDITYTVADELAVDAIDDVGGWKVWLDADSGAPIARATTLRWATSTGIVAYDVPDQSPTGTRSPHPAPLASFTVNGTAQTSTLDGVVTWDGTSPASVMPALVGSRVRVVNKSGTAAIPSALSLAPNGTATWSQAATPTADANLDAYIYANHAKQFTKTHLNPNLAWLDRVMTVNTNVNQTCNANSNGDSVNFFVANTQCENTGRIADVVYHETGHSVHNQSVIPGAGSFDTAAAGSLSEGMADTMAVSITGDHGVGRGFFFNNNLLRDLAPTTPKHWPEDADGEPHDEGEIIGEALWDMRQALQTSMGVDAGYAQTLKIYYNIMQRSPDIPGAFAEALAADDDNGDLTDGTPNLCAIKTAFDRHGLASDTSVISGVTPPTRDGFTISIKNPVGGAAANCGGAPTATGAHVEWRVRGGTSAMLPLTLANGSFTGQIPQQPDGAVVEYRVTMDMSDSTSVGYPNNPADPYYQFYVGTPTKLWCTDFESGAADWTHGGATDEWQVGTPMGLATDPKTAFSGSNVFGQDLSNDGLYSDNGASFAQSPAIDLMGNTANVHLQYQRWLGVEDGVCDTAQISANGTSVWKNFASPTTCANVTTEVNHLDKEWRFQDVDVSAQAAAATDGKLTLKFDLTADQGLGFGGWTIDDVCLVVTKPAPTSTCGDGMVTGSETCDDGNGVDGDGCSASCQIEGAGGKESGGCCSSSTDPTSALALGTIVFGGLVLRRRRRARR